MNKYCEDCGCQIFGGHCVNCHEETFMAEQYMDLDEEVPLSIQKKVLEQERKLSKFC